MKALLNLLLFFTVAFFLTACDLSSTSGEELLGSAETSSANAGFDANNIQEQNHSQEPSSPPASTPSSPPSSGTPASNGPVPNGIGNGFLWKPHSESTGNLVILTPQATRGRTEGVATISGSFGTESAPMRHEHHNGGRPHFYFDRHGREYGTNITVTVPLTDGSVYSAVVPNGAVRTE